MEKMRVLYIASEVAPFLATSSVATFVQALAKYMHKKELEVRVLVPRFGVINERRNNLHEVVRLSGANITIGADTQPLTIKVASIPNAKLQVYFIDNEVYFKRKAVFHDTQQRFFEDNDARTVFFCKSALETVKQLGWVPDVIHCHDWMTSLIPMYLKTAYQHEPVLNKAKVIFTLYNTAFPHEFDTDLAEKAMTTGLKKGDAALASLASSDFGVLIQTGIKYADVVMQAEALDQQVFQNLVDEQALIKVVHDDAGLATCHDLYKQLAPTR